MDRAMMDAQMILGSTSFGCLANAAKTLSSGNKLLKWKKNFERSSSFPEDFWGKDALGKDKED